MLDKGTFGTVFRAYDTKHKEPVAVKVLSLCVCVWNRDGVKGRACGGSVVHAAAVWCMRSQCGACDRCVVHAGAVAVCSCRFVSSVGV